VATTARAIRAATAACRDERRRRPAAGQPTLTNLGRHLAFFLAGAAAFAALAATGAGADLPTLYVGYTSDDCTFRLTNDSGAAVTTIAPGTYQVAISTPDPFGLFGNSGSASQAACRGFVQFRLTGPGVTLFTTLDYGDAAFELYSETFRAGGTYTLQDDGNVAVSRRSFTFSATGSAGSSTPTNTSSAAATTSTAFRGALEVVVSRGGRVVVTRKGKPIGALKAGRYSISVRDTSKQDGFSLQPPKGKVQAITNAAYLGVRVLTVTLAPGRCTFFAPGGTKIGLAVVR
jgi:hypothetical protein